MYNSNYPTSYGSYGSMGSYGGYGSQYGGSSMMGGMRNGQNPQLPNNQQNPDQNESKLFVNLQGKKSSNNISR